MSADLLRKPLAFPLCAPLLGLLGLLLMMLGGCGGGESADALLASAKGYLARNDTPAAVIQLKNALQKNPDSAEARFLLGQAQLAGGDAAAATLELRRALDLRHPQAQVLPVLARAFIAERQYKSLTDRYTAVDLAEPAAAADLKTSVALAHLAQGDAAAGRAALEAALRAAPGHAPALLLQARIEAGERRFDAATALVDKVIAAAPSNADAWHDRGDLLLFGKSDPEQALRAYRQALSLAPAHPAARTSLISLLLDRGEPADAAAQIEALRKSAPQHPQTMYFDARLAFLQHDLDKAQGLVRQLLERAPDSVKALQLAGMLQFQGGAFAEAERSLGKALQLAPELAASRRLLARTQLRSSQPAKALATLQPLLTGAEPDAEAHALAAEAQLQAGSAAEAERSFARAAQLDPSDTKSRLALALVQIDKARVDKGHGDAALAGLQKIAGADSAGRADLALIALHIRAKDYARAMQAIDALEAKQPTLALAANLRGRVHLLRNDSAAARRSFERALAIDARDGSAALALAGLDLADKQPERARQRFESVLALDPNNLEALLAIAGMRSRSGATKDEVAGLLGDAIKRNPAERGPRLLLVEHLLKHKDHKAALGAAQDGLAALPDSPQLLDALGRAQAAAGNANQAVTTFGKLAALEPISPQPHLRLAAVHLAAKDTAAAEHSLRRALAIRHDLLPAQQSLLALQLAAGRNDEALQLARGVQKQRPGEPAGFIFEGNVEVARNDLAAAADLYRGVLTKFPSATEAAVKLHAVLVAMGKAAEAERLAASWLAAHPTDAVFLSHQGEVSLAGRSFELAERQFRGVIALQPDNAAALNNVSWLMARQNKPGAVDFARKAVALRPDAPALLDTLAIALAADNQVGPALEVQKKALALEPGSPTLRLGLARLYVRSGDKTAARAELDALVKLGPGFTAQPEVGELLKTL